MAYDRAMDIVRLAIRLQGTGAGLTLDDIQREFEVSRRTAERLRNAVEVVAFDYAARATGQRTRRGAEPYGLIYGNRAFLVGRAKGGAESQGREGCVRCLVRARSSCLVCYCE